MCLACQQTISQDALDAFGERFLGILNNAATAIMISLGYRNGLFEAMRQLPPATSAEIATAAGCNERYVREWLGAMTTAGITACDDDGRLFWLPPAHQAMLTDGAGGENLAHLAQYIGLMGGVEDDVARCFREGGGVPYDRYPRFHEVMAQDSSQTIVAALHDHLIPLVPGLRAQLEDGITVLDIGCGRGMALLELARSFPQSQFTGYDLSTEATAWAQARADEEGLTNVTFAAWDLTTFDEDAPVAAFDLIFAFDAIHDQARPDRVLAGVRRALNDDGLFYAQDIAAATNIAANRDHPLAPLLYGISCLHCMTVSLAQGGMGLGAMWGEAQAREFFAAAGFTQVTRETLPHDIQNYYYLCRP